MRVLSCIQPDNSSVSLSLSLVSTSPLLQTTSPPVLSLTFCPLKSDYRISLPYLQVSTFLLRALGLIDATFSEMEVVASAFAVVSLAVEVVETGEKISQFLMSVQDAPNEFVNLGQTLESLNGTLKQVTYLLEQQYQTLSLPGSSVHITNALENCEKRIKTLDGVIQKGKTNMDHRNRVHRSWAAMRFVWKKEEIQEMRN